MFFLEQNCVCEMIFSVTGQYMHDFLDVGVILHFISPEFHCLEFPCFDQKYISVPGLTQNSDHIPYLAFLSEQWQFDRGGRGTISILCHVQITSWWLEILSCYPPLQGGSTDLIGDWWTHRIAKVLLHGPWTESGPYDFHWPTTPSIPCSLWSSWGSWKRLREI